MEKFNLFDRDSFSNGQIDSKLWLCRELEKLNWTSESTHIYGGWYGVLAFLLLTREKFVVKRIESYDIDGSCENIANIINNNYVIKEKFYAYTCDCNNLKSNSDLIINTASEHFTSMDWFNRIEYGKRVIIQGNDMPHDDHVIHSESLQDFLLQYPLNEIAYSGEIEFVYPDWSFRRYMVIGKK